MKRILCALILALATFRGRAQGTFIYDQQSATESTSGVNVFLDSLQLQPLGQSFTPTFDSVGFIRLWITELSTNSVAIDLHANSITGPILGSTEPVLMTVSGPANFFFSAPVAVSPGTTYYFQVDNLAGASGNCYVQVGAYNYPGGTFYINGASDPTDDLWFREGVVPEPSTCALFVAGATLLYLYRRR